MRYLFLYTALFTLIGCGSTQAPPPKKTKNDIEKAFEQAEQRKSSYQQIVISSEKMKAGVRFNYLPLKTISESDTATRYKYHGNNGKFNASLNILAPHCNVEPSNENHLKCILPKILSSPLFKVIKKSIRTKKHPGGIILTYMAVLSGGDKMMHSHLLFTHNDNWGDFHMSIITPEQSDIIALLDIEKALTVIKN